MSYTQIDPVISAWMQKNGLTLFTSIEGQPDVEFRSIYVSRGGECYQVWSDQPQDGNVKVHVADVETESNDEVRRGWQVPLAELDGALEGALSFVLDWFRKK